MNPNFSSPFGAYPSNPYAGSGYAYQNTSPTYGVHTNIVRVTSLEEAIMRTNERGSDMMYIHQDKDILYRVKVDFDGKKSWGEFPIVVPNQTDNAPATKSDIQALTARIEALEGKAFTEVPKDAEPV